MNTIMRRSMLSLLAMLSFPAAAIECIKPETPVTPVLVMQEVRADIQGVEDERLLTALKERLVAGGKYRVAMPDQYRYALQNHKIDKCTPALGVRIVVGMDTSDPGAAYGLGGLVTRREFSARAEVEMLPDGVSVDTVALKEKADTVVGGKKVQEAFGRLLEKLAGELESHRDAWTNSDTPGF